MLRRLRLWDNPPPAPIMVTPARLPPPTFPPRPMITYEKGLPSLPDDIICEIFSLLDVEALKSCSLTGKALSCWAKPFIHRTLHLTYRSGDPQKPRVPGRWNELEGLPTLGERGLLQHTRHISVALPYSLHFPRTSLHPCGLDPHIQHLHALTNLRSFKARYLDISSFIPKMEEYFGAFLGTLQSLELESPTGDHKQILYFACQFPNLRDLKITSFRLCPNPTYNGGPHFEIDTSPPFDGTLDLNWNVGPESDPMGAHPFLHDLVALPSGPKFRTLKISECTSSNLQLLIDACAPTLECMEFTAMRSGVLFLHRGCLRSPLFIRFNYQALQNILSSVSNVTLRCENLKSH